MNYLAMENSFLSELGWIIGRQAFLYAVIVILSFLCVALLSMKVFPAKAISVKKRRWYLLYKISTTSAFHAMLTCIVNIVFLGCVSTPDYVVQSPEQLATQFKSEHPTVFAPQEVIAVQDAGKLFGEWEGESISICQTDSEHGKGVRKFMTLYTYQFFKDNTYNLISKHYGGTSVSQGMWSYKDGVLLLHTYKDNVLQRGVPMHLKWHSESSIEYQYEIDAYKKNCMHVIQGEIFRLDVCYDDDGFQIYESDQETMGVRFQAIQITSPAILKRVGDAIKPSGTAGMQNPITHDEVFKGQMEARQRMAEARQREIEAGAAVSEAIVQGANAFSAAMSQQQQANRPVVVSQPIVKPQPIQPKPVQQTTTFRPNTVKPYHREVRPPSFYVGTNPDGSMKVSDQGWRDRKK